VGATTQSRRRRGDALGHRVSWSADGRTLAVLADTRAAVRWSGAGVPVPPGSRPTGSGRPWAGGYLEPNGYGSGGGTTRASAARCLGRSVSFSADGSICECGHCIYAFTSRNMGSVGQATARSEDGGTIAVGTIRSNDISGYVRLYRCTIQHWRIG
jgi:hypothetical protein